MQSIIIKKKLKKIENIIQDNRQKTKIMIKNIFQLQRAICNEELIH